MKEILLDYSKQCGDEPEKGHNRWHPDIPPAVRADEGEEVVMQTRNAFDGQITPNTQPLDLLATNLGLVHPLTGPVYVNGAEPGDLLEVNVLNVEPASWGFTTILPGFGFLRDLYTEPFICHWEMRDGVRHLGTTAGCPRARGVVHGHHRRSAIAGPAARDTAA